MVTGGAGFVGSHTAEYYQQKGEEVVVFDNLSRAALLKYDSPHTYNWNYLKSKGIELINGDIRDFDQVRGACEGVDVIVHTAAQTAVTTSVQDPKTDFEVNTLGTFNVLEAARRNDVETVVYCSTNKVYGENVNNLEVIEKETRYAFKNFRGVPEDFPVDLCEHTPYGCSKLAGDLYTQDYGHLYGLKTGVFRMSCIYGTRQFGVEDQGWVAWFTIATILGKPITIYGDGKQVRDVLYVTDLVRAYDAFLENGKSGVYNMGGGSENTLSLLELLDLLEEFTGRKSPIRFDNWRPSDQKVYISDITRAKTELGWRPEINPREGVKRLVGWVEANKENLQ